MDGIRRFMLFRGERYPEERGAVKGKALLIPRAVSRRPHRTGPRPGMERAKKPARRPVLFTREEAPAVLARWGRGPMRDGEPLVRLWVATLGVRRLRVTDIVSDNTCSSVSGFDYKLPGY